MAVLIIDFEAMPLRAGRRIVADLPERHRYDIADAKGIAAEAQRVCRRLTAQEVAEVLHSDAHTAAPAGA